MTETETPDIFAVLERAHRAEKCVMVFGTALEWIARHPDATDRLRVAIRETLEQT